VFEGRGSVLNPAWEPTALHRPLAGREDTRHPFLGILCGSVLLSLLIDCG